jgi:tetratricopeptide (TPR) repeat protein
LKKFFFFWGDYEVHDIDSTYKNYLTIQSWPLIPFGIIAALGILGMGLSIGRFRETFLLYWMVLVYLFSVLVFFAASRYRLPAIPFLCIFAACAVNSLLLHVRDGSWKKCGAYLGITLAVYAGVNLPFRDQTRRFDQWQRATRIHYSLGGTLLFQKGRYPEAIREFQLTLDLQPGFVPAYNYLGKSYAILNQYEQAEEAFRRVVQLAPEIDTGYMNLGLLYQLKGDRPQAMHYIGKALSLNPGNRKARTHLEAMQTHEAR